MTTRNGKIARLPKTLRDELNQHLQNGVPGTTLVKWLNGLPAVQALVQNQFDGHPIREQNISQWKSGGYRDWLQQQEALEVADRLHEGAEALLADQDRSRLSEVLELWLVARYAVATREIAATKGPKGWRLLRQMCADIVKLRRMDQHDDRLALEGDRIALRREQLASQRPRKAAPEEDHWGQWTDEARLAWARRPENCARVCSWDLARAAMHKHDDWVWGRETDSDRKADEETRQWLESLREQHRTRAWTEEEKFAWLRLPENLGRIMFEEGADPVCAARNLRRSFLKETAEDKAYFAQQEAAEEAKKDEEERGAGEDKVENEDADPMTASPGEPPPINLQQVIDPTPI